MVLLTAKKCFCFREPFLLAARDSVPYPLISLFYLDLSLLHYGNHGVLYSFLHFEAELLLKPVILFSFLVEYHSVFRKALQHLSLKISDTLDWFRSASARGS